MVITGKIFDGVDLDQDRTSETVDMSDRPSASLQFDSAADTRAGSIVIETRLSAAAEWVKEPFYDDQGTLVDSIPVTAATALAATVDLDNLRRAELRARFIDSTGGSGEGTLNGWVRRG